MRLAGAPVPTSYRAKMAAALGSTAPAPSRQQCASGSTSLPAAANLPGGHSQSPTGRPTLAVERAMEVDRAAKMPLPPSEPPSMREARLSHAQPAVSERKAPASTKTFLPAALSERAHLPSPPMASWRRGVTPSPAPSTSVHASAFDASTPPSPLKGAQQQKRATPTTISEDGGERSAGGTNVPGTATTSGGGGGGSSPGPHTSPAAHNVGGDDGDTTDDEEEEALPGLEALYTTLPAPRVQGRTGHVYDSHGGDNLSLCCLPHQEPRRSVIYLVESSPFENLVLLTIMLNCCTMVAEHPVEGPTPETLAILAVCDMAFLYIYTSETFCRMFAYGMHMLPGSFLLNGWGIFEAFIVAASWIPVLFPSFTGGLASAP